MSQAASAPAPASATSAAATSAAPTRWRSISAVVCLVLAALLTTPAAFAYWGQRTLNDTQRYVDTVGPLVDSPEVQTAIATKVTDAIQQQVNVESLLNNVFQGVITQQPKLKQLVGPIAAAVNGLIARTVQDFIASQTFRDLWVVVNTRAQEALHQLLSGNAPPALSVQGDQVVLDLGTVITSIEQQLQARGLSFVGSLPLPTVDKQIVLLTSPQLKQVRTIYAFANPVAQWLLFVVILLYLAAYLLSRRRPRMAVIIGALLVVNALLLALVLSIGRQLFVNQLTGTVFGPASTVFYNQLLTYLVRGRKVVMWVGILLVFVGWYLGAHRSGTAARHAVSRTLEDTGGNLADTPAVGVAGWVARNARWVRLAIGILGVVILVWGNYLSTAKVFWATIIVVLLLAAVQALIGTAHTARDDEVAVPGAA